MAEKRSKAEGVLRDVLRQRGESPAGYLGDPEVVGQILKHHAQQFIRRADAWASKEMTTDEASDADLKDCNKLARIFIGMEPGYTPVGPWNTGGGLAQALRKSLGLSEKDDHRAVFLGIEAFHREIYKALTPVMRGTISGEEGGKMIESTMHKYALLLSGVSVGAP